MTLHFSSYTHRPFVYLLWKNARIFCPFFSWVFVFLSWTHKGLEGFWNHSYTGPQTVQWNRNVECTWESVFLKFRWSALRVEKHWITPRGQVETEVPCESAASPPITDRAASAAHPTPSASSVPSTALSWAEAQPSELRKTQLVLWRSSRSSREAGP